MTEYDDASLRHQIGTYLVVENAPRQFRFALLLVKVRLELVGLLLNLESGQRGSR